SLYLRQYPPQKLPVKEVNQVLYSFMDFGDNGAVFTGDEYADTGLHFPNDTWNEMGNNAYGAVKQLGLLKRVNRHLKVIISIGGSTWSTNFSAVAADATRRATFAKSAVDIVKNYGFDGIDIDWEYPTSSADAANFVLLLEAVRAELDAYSKRAASDYHFILSAATPAGPASYKMLNLKRMGDVLDYLNIMTYDYAGGWDLTHTAHQANLFPNPANPDSTPFSSDRAITDYLQAGVPSWKIVMGIPLYGRGFEGTSGLGRPATDTGSGTWQAGIYDYKALPLDGSIEKYDNIAGAAYSVDIGSRRVISYDTITSVEKKLSYVRAKGLGGTMFWEASGDKAGEGSIVNACFKGLGGNAKLDKTANLLSYPESIYDNVRNGFA
ncbi:family 18 glycosyl hydrolase, partial [Microdochium bolleyi]